MRNINNNRQQLTKFYIKFKNQTRLMNPHKKQSIQKQLTEQSGSDNLDLNDIVLGYDGARIVGALLPQYHKNLRHIKINGNNIDAQGFQCILSGLRACSYLKSIEAEWNSIGSEDVGLAALETLAANLNNLELIDLKNNRISHHHAHYIASIIQLNKKNLRVIDLRWNELGELGAKQILGALAMNRNIKFIGLEDNRISMGTLMEIQSMLKNGYNPGQEGSAGGKVLKHSSSMPNSFGQDYYPISANDYPSMDAQLKTGELRSKLQAQQKQANRFIEKVQTQIQKTLNKIKLKATQINENQLRYDALVTENTRVTSELRQAQRMLALKKQQMLGTETRNMNELALIRNQKYKVNVSIQNVMQKYTQRNQRQLEQIDLVMGQKLDRLTAFLKQRLHEKRLARDKLTQLKQDILKYRIQKQQLSNRELSSPGMAAMTSQFDTELYALQQQLALVETAIQNQIKKGDYMSKQLNNQIIKALNKEQNLEKEINQIKQRIKGRHHEILIKIVEMQKNLAQARIKDSQIMDKQATIEMQSKYLKYLQSQGSIKYQVESMINQQQIKGSHTSEQSIEIRIGEVERALRAQQAQNRLIKNQYEKLMAQMENVTKKNIQLVLFQ